MAGGNSHQRAMERTAKSRITDEVTETVLTRIREANLVVTKPKNKNLPRRLLDFIEQPLVLSAVGVVSGIVGVLIYTPIFIICAFCILLGFHKAGVVSGLRLRVQIVSYFALMALLSIGGYFLYGALDTAFVRSQTAFAKKVAGFREPHATTDSVTTKVEHPPANSPPSNKPTELSASEQESRIAKFVEEYRKAHPNFRAPRKDLLPADAEKWMNDRLAKEGSPYRVQLPHVQLPTPQPPAVVVKGHGHLKMTDPSFMKATKTPKQVNYAAIAKQLEIFTDEIDKLQESEVSAWTHKVAHYTGFSQPLSVEEHGKAEVSGI
jgi:hypothetical protein